MNFKNFRYIIVVIACITVTTIQAQREYFKPELAVGARGGATAAFTISSPTISEGMLYGFTSGAVVRYITEKYVGFQVELNYTQRGWIENNSEYTYQRRLSYVELPFMTHIWLGKRAFRWFFNIGPQISYLVQDEPKSDNRTIFHSKVQHNMAISNRFDYGIIGGTGFEFNTKKAGIYQLEARYYFGLGNFFPTSAGDSFRMASSQSISLCLGILFNTSK